MTHELPVSKQKQNPLHLQHLLQSLQQLDLNDHAGEVDELLHLDRMIMLGELVNGLAHELQNPLSGIKAAIQTLSRKQPDDDPNQPVYQHIISTTNRLHELVLTILMFARKGEMHKQRVDINSIVNECIHALSGKQSASVSVFHEFASGLPELEGDRHFLRLCLMNLLVNALEIKPEGLELHISTHFIDRSQNVDMNHFPEWGNPFRCKNGVLQIRIQDNGPGVPEAIADRIFQPFFTTKPQGSGFGLYFSSQIVRQHHGCIFCRNNKKAGATFTLCLPIPEDNSKGQHQS